MASLVDGQRYEKQKFTKLVERGSTFAGIEFDSCSFDGCVLSECSFYRCRFAGCRFSNCDLSVLRVPNTRFVDVGFTGSKLVGVDWTKAGDSVVSRMPLSVGFDGCVLNLSIFFGLQLKGSRLARCTAHEVDFAEADLSEADCSGSDFAGSTFLHTDLTRANFTGATGYAINPAANTVKKARFSLPEAVSLLSGFDVIIE